MAMLITSQQSRVQDRTRTVLLLGEGPLATALARRWQKGQEILFRQYREPEELPDDSVPLAVGLVVAVSSHWRPAYDRAIQCWCWERGVALLRVSIWQQEAVIGPLVIPGVPGCLECMEVRHFRTSTRDAKNEAAFGRWCDAGDERIARRPQNPWATQAALNTIALLADDEVRAYLEQNASRVQTCSARFLNLRALTNSCHTFLPYPQCPVCGTAGPDRAEDAQIDFEPRPRPNLRSYRLRSLADDLEELEKRFVDTKLGLKIEPASAIFANEVAFTSVVSHHYEYPDLEQHTACGGFAYSFRASRATAIIEAMERYNSYIPRARNSSVYGSYHQLADRAIDPESFGLYTPEQYALHSQRPSPYCCSPYSPDLALHWSWCYSLRRQRPVLIPEEIAYYAACAIRPQTEHFLLDTSTGCAVGSTIEEAALYGLFEVIERDAFSLTWYARLPLPPLDMSSSGDISFKLALERTQRISGFTIHAFDATTDLGIPAILCVARNPRPEAPRLLYAAAAHWDPERALASAFYEVSAGISQMPARFPRDLERGRQLLEDSSQVLSIDDHLLVGAMPEAYSRSQFLLQPRPLQSLHARFAEQYKLRELEDLTEIFMRSAQRVLDKGYDVLIVRQTSPELQEIGLHCVRVLVPGLIPLAFGHDYRRVRGLERLYRLPRELGYIDRLLTEADLNPYPHAFP